MVNRKAINVLGSNSSQNPSQQSRRLHTYREKQGSGLEFIQNSTTDDQDEIPEEESAVPPTNPSSSSALQSISQNLHRIQQISAA